MKKNTLCLLFSVLLSTSWGQSFEAQVGDSVEVIIDAWGVPHVFANSQEDLFFAQGFQAAKDRLFQFEIWRRQATGTVAEILGARELKRDIGARLFQFRGDMNAELNHYHPQGKMIITRFVAGVNAYIDWILEHPERLPLEFDYLNIKPQPWTPEVVVSRHQGLLGNIGQELNLGRLVHLIGPEKVKELFWFHPFEPILEMDTAINSSHLFEDILELYNAFRKPVSFLPEDLGTSSIPSGSLREFSEYKDPTMGVGSNNWVVSGAKTQSGYPMMANDPHRKLSIPSLRYIAHLSAPGWNVIGGGEPEIPGISIGHNEYGAWGLTVFRTDAEDLYVYKLHPEDPDKYWHKGVWMAMEKVMDTIQIKNEGSIAVEHKYTVHGPVVFQDSKEHIGYVVRCGWLEIGGSPYLASLRLNQSLDFESFRDACNYFHIPGENMVWADRNGQIGWQAVGIAPVRHGFSGLVPIPGDGNYEWTDYLEIKRKPHKTNPREGVIITANENVTSLEYSFPEAIGYTWADPFRGDRITEVLMEGTQFSMMDMMRLQTDDQSLIARTLIPLLETLTTDDEKIANAMDLLIKWDKHMRPSSVEATIYHRWETILSARMREMKIPEPAKPYIQYIQPSRWVPWLLFPDGDFGADPVQGRDELLIEALRETLTFLVDRLGEDRQNWTYGQPGYKHVQIKHVLGDILPDSVANKLNTAIVPRGGYGYTVGSTGGSLNQTSGATFRIIVDTEDWDKTLVTNAPGQSGDPESKYYQNLFRDWSKNKYFPLFYSRDKIKSVADHTYYLIPHE